MLWSRLVIHPTVQNPFSELDRVFFIAPSPPLSLFGHALFDRPDHSPPFIHRLSSSLRTPTIEKLLHGSTSIQTAPPAIASQSAPLHAGDPLVFRPGSAKKGRNSTTKEFLLASEVLRAKFEIPLSLRTCGRPLTRWFPRSSTYRDGQQNTATASFKRGNAGTIIHADGSSAHGVLRRMRSPLRRRNFSNG